MYAVSNWSAQAQTYSTAFNLAWLHDCSCPDCKKHCCKVPYKNKDFWTQLYIKKKDRTKNCDEMVLWWVNLHVIFVISSQIGKFSFVIFGPWQLVTPLNLILITRSFLGDQEYPLMCSIHYCFWHFVFSCIFTQLNVCFMNTSNYIASMHAHTHVAHSADQHDVYIAQ